MVKYLAEPRNILAEPLGSAEPRLKNTVLDHNKSKPILFFPKVYFKHKIWRSPVGTMGTPALGECR